MREIWSRIEAILGKQAPALLAKLPPGLSADAIAAVETELGFALPADVRESYAVRDGSGDAGILPQDDYGRVNGVKMIPLGWVAGEREEWNDMLDDGEFDGTEAKPEGPAKAEWWNRKWLPFTENGGGDHMCIDLDPAPGGTVGQVIDFRHDAGPRRVPAPSLRVYLEQLAADLETGRLRYDETGELVAGE
ncbi:MAG: SMI1/KNR4 family protein [Fimbriiglobus sp.]